MFKPIIYIVLFFSISHKTFAMESTLENTNTIPIINPSVILTHDDKTQKEIYDAFDSVDYQHFTNYAPWNLVQEKSS